ncbi:MAG: hypothetical protein LC660_12210 [Desulfobacteraceae bacterium]|nr:hypothetical protein [Desulfobacteraceae bacterium]
MTMERISLKNESKKADILGGLYGIEAGLKVCSEKLGDNDDFGMESIVAALTDKLTVQIKELDIMFCREMPSDN